MKNIYRIVLMTVICFLNACTPKPTILPAIVPQPEKITKPVKRPPNVIGAVEPVYFLPMKSAFYARIDTGAATSSLDVSEINPFERDGESWVSFEIVNKRTGEKHLFEKPVVKQVTIKRIEQKEHRYKVMMDVSFASRKFQAEFTLADRQDFEYQALIGRNILTGRAIVDTSLSHTLK